MPPSGTGLYNYRFQLYALGEPLPLTPAAAASVASQSIADSAIVAASTVYLFGG